MKGKRRDLFVRPTSPGEVTPIDGWLREAYINRPVFEPILGESVYVTCEQFGEFVEAVRAFLLNLADSLERVA